MKVAFGQVCVLNRSIAAIPIVADLFGEAEFGILDKLPARAALSVCGRGFNADTTRVTWKGQDYIVFLADIQDQRKARGTI